MLPALLVTVNVYIMSSPSVGVAVFTVLVVTKSVLVTVIDSDKSSAVVLLSAWSETNVLAVFTIVVPKVPAFTCASIINKAFAPLAKVPIDHKPDPEL